MMKLRNLIKASATAAMVFAVGAYSTGQASADDFPTKPITMIIPFGAGGSHDVNARMFTTMISNYLGQPMIVKLIPGAGGQKGTSEVVKAKPDGYTMIFTHNYIDQMQPLTETLPYDTNKELVAVYQVNDSAPYIWVPSDKPWKTLKEMLDWGRENPGKLRFASSGKWGSSFTPAAMMLLKAGVDAKFIPNKGGGAAKRAVLAGDADFAFGRDSTILSEVKAGTARVLAVAGTERSEHLPDIPTFTELGFDGKNAVMTRVVLASRAVPEERLKKVRDAFEQLQGDKTYQKLMSQIGENTKAIPGPEYEKIRLEQRKAYEELVKKMTGQ